MFFRYFRMRGKGILVFLLFCAIFAVVFTLFQLPLEPVLYSAAVCAFAGLIIVIIDYIHVYKKLKEMEQLKREISITLDSMPPAHTLLEKEYQQIIQTLFADKTRLSDEMNSRYANLVEYYTLWAHQIKTPIAAMRLLLQSEDTAQNRELLEELQRIEQYVEMVLCYLRLDSSSTDYVIQKYDLDGIVRQAVRKYASQFIRKKIKLLYEPLNCQVLTDEKWLLFVVEQVLSNALKYTKSGEISITLEEPKTLCISDTGIGIAPEDLPRIFEKGFTGYNGRDDKKASGIGLYLCRRICEKLGHRISAVSSVGEGTQIRICLKSAELEME